MKNTLAIRWCLSLALLPAVLSAPADATTGVAPVHNPRVSALLPGMHGEGSGIWRAPGALPGRMRASSRVGTDGPVFAFDAVLTQVGSASAISSTTQGRLVGEMLAVDPVDGSHAVAIVIGEWTQEPSGDGWFVAHIGLLTGDAAQPVAVGRCFGPFRTPPAGERDPRRGTVNLRWDANP